MLRNKFKTALKDMFESLGPQASVTTIREMLSEGKISSDDFSLRETWEACEGLTVKSTTESAVDTSLFSVITGEIINSKVIQAYKAVPDVGSRLVTVVPSKKSYEIISGFTAGAESDLVLQGAPYNESIISEKYVQSLPAEKYGRLISLTMEMIMFDQTRSIMKACEDIGRQIGNLRQQRIIESVMDEGKWNGNVYRPSNVATDLFSSSNGNLISSNPFGETGILNVLKYMEEQTDEEGQYINVPAENLVGLFPVDLWVRAEQMRTSKKTPEGVEAADNVWKNMYTALKSPWTSASSESTWYFGVPSMQFSLLEVLPIQTFTQNRQSDQAFERDIDYRYKVRTMFMMIAEDYRYWYKCTA